LKYALWHWNLVYSAGPLLGRAGISWGLNSGIYFLSGNEKSKTSDELGCQGY